MFNLLYALIWELIISVLASFASWSLLNDVSCFKRVVGCLAGDHLPSNQRLDLYTTLSCFIISVLVAEEPRLNTLYIFFLLKCFRSVFIKFKNVWTSGYGKQGVSPHTITLIKHPWTSSRWSHSVQSPEVRTSKTVVSASKDAEQYLCASQLIYSEHTHSSRD